jgi:hypothetical protein
MFLFLLISLVLQGIVTLFVMKALPQTDVWVRSCTMHYAFV